MHAARHKSPRGPAAWVACALALAVAAVVPAAGKVGQGIQGAARKLAPSDADVREVAQASGAPVAAQDAPRKAIQLPEAARDLVEPGSNLEIGEIQTPRDLLREDERISRLLREEAEFRYDPQNRPDPMVAPWVRARVMARELTDIAEQAMEREDLKKARRAYGLVQDLEQKLKNTGFGVDSIQEFLAKALTGLARLKELETERMAAEEGATGKEPPKPKLPPWVRGNTRGIIYDTVDPVVLIGPYTLRQGDIVPDQPVEVVVDKINRQTVVYRVREATFEVHIEEGE